MFLRLIFYSENVTTNDRLRERKRERETERQRDRDRDIQRDRGREKERKSETFLFYSNRHIFYSSYN